MLGLLFRPLGIMAAGIGLMGLAAILWSNDPASLPAQSELKQVSGVLDKAAKVTTKRRRGGERVDYELEIKQASGEVVKLKLPEKEISEPQVLSLFGKPVSAAYSGEKDVWVLAAGATSILDYETTKKKRIQTAVSNREEAPYVAGGGFLALLLGVFWWRRRGSV